MAFATLACIMPVLSNGQESEPRSPAEGRIATYKLLLKPSRNRPHAPTDECIYCLYAEGNIWFTFPNGITTMSVHVGIGDSQNEGDYIVTPNCTIFIGFPSQTVEVVCRTDENQLFSGEIQLTSSESNQNPIQE